ncbi:MAG: asparagine synthase (glutamine-hydrolyzing) [Lachnospiraceae bacterium]|nr:asparagine synthase (glutamine-hydrolyzing) [Lachnospiraceae bacterium]
MCGIAGIAGYSGDPITDIEAMNKRMHRRGPDAGGHFLDENRRVVIGHRRLSIIDLSDTGAQPMESPDGRYVIAFNGEIYNAHSIKDELEAQHGPLNLKGTSDTEVLLNAISLGGLTDTLKKSRGMWGISLYDKESGDIMLTRDRMGEKPLYYGTVKGQFVWASDINSITAVSGFDNPVRKDIIPVYLRYGYIPAPYTIYEGIYKLTPGTVLTISAPYKVNDDIASAVGADAYNNMQSTGFNIKPYYNIKEVAACGQSNPFKGSEEEAADELEARLKSALKGQMLSDVPLGAFLSGGIDSTMVVSLMQQISDDPVRTFTIGFEEEEFNEASFAAATAAHLGTKHTEMYVGYKDVINLLPSLGECYGEPFADSSQLPTMLVSGMTKQHVTVALSGDAGDEFYCGYNTYKDAIRGLNVMQSKLGFLKGGLRQAAGNTAGAFDRLLSSSGLSLSNDLHKLHNVLTVNTIEEYYRAMSDSAHISGLTGKSFISAGLPKVSDDIYPDGLLYDPESNLMLMDMMQYLPDDILTKVDRAGMYYSLETRIPLLDADVIDFAWSLPLSYKMSDGITKKPLRNILYRYVPKEMMDRPKKGFSVPVSKWLLSGEMNTWAEDVLLSGRSAASEYIDMTAFDRIWQQYKNDGRYSTVIWYVLMLCQWCMR